MSEVLAVVLGAALGSLLAPLILAWRARPILKFDYLDDQLVGHDGQVFHRLLVRNKGQTAAVRCAAFITLEPIAPGDAIASRESLHSSSAFEHRPRLEYEMLCWAKSGNPSEVTIYPHSGTRLDLFMVNPVERSQADMLVIPSELGWNTYRIGLRPGHYDGTVVVAGENARPCALRFRIEATSLQLQEARWFRRRSVAALRLAKSVLRRVS